MKKPKYEIPVTSMLEEIVHDAIRRHSEELVKKLEGLQPIDTPSESTYWFRQGLQTAIKIIRGEDNK